MPPLSVLIKSASSACNLKCEYCFYRSVSSSREQENMGLMQIETLEQLVKNVLGSAEGYCCFAFQGGEPTLSGLPFYRRLIEFEKQYNTRNLTIENTIQTNGILIDEEWAKFFAENHFLVGISLDGPRKINDLYRIRGENRGSFDAIMHTMELFEKYKVDFNILSVITSKSAPKSEQIYRFYRKLQVQFMQFIPCLDEYPGQCSAYSLKHGQYGKFLTDIFALWEKDFVAGVDVEVRFFTNLIQMAAGYPAEACGMCGYCMPYPVVEGDGSVYPCDFYVTDEWRLGDVTMPLTDLLTGDTAQTFAAPSLYQSTECEKCPYFALCRGGCRRWREPIATGTPSLNLLCEDYKIFFETCYDRIFALAKRYL